MDVLAVGTSLGSGRYRISRHLSTGGFGITYEVKQPELNRVLCLKEFYLKGHSVRISNTIQPIAGSEEMYAHFLRKFVEESRKLAGLNHPNIVRVIDSFVENGSAYYVMDLLSGPSMQDLLNQSEISTEKAIGYVCEIAEALRLMHAQQMCHLDIKPQNIMLDSYGHAVLIDFGSSKQFDYQSDPNQTTIPVVSLRYAPPEQSNGVTAFSPRVDIFSLTAVLYALLTGKRPPRELLSSESKLPDHPALTVDLRRFIFQGMSPFPDNRPASIDLWLAKLKAIIKPSALIEVDTEATNLLKILQAKYHDLQQSFGQLEAELIQSQQNQDLHTSQQAQKLVEMEQAYKASQESLELERQKMASIQTEISLREQQLSMQALSLADEKQKLEVSRLAQITEIQAINNEKATLNKELENLRSLKSKLQKQEQGLEIQRTELDKRKQDLEIQRTELDQREQELRKSHAALESVDKKLRQKEVQQQNLDQQLSSKKDELHKLNTSCTNARATLDKVKQELEQMQAKRGSLRWYTLQTLVFAVVVASFLSVVLGWSIPSVLNQEPIQKESIDLVEQPKTNAKHSLAEWSDMLQRELNIVDELYKQPSVDYHQVLKHYNQAVTCYRDWLSEYGESLEAKEAYRILSTSIDERIKYYAMMAKYDPSTDYEQEYIQPLRAIKSKI